MVGNRTCLGAGTICEWLDEADGGGGFLMFLVMHVVRVASKSRVRARSSLNTEYPGVTACYRTLSSQSRCYYIDLDRFYYTESWSFCQIPSRNYHPPSHPRLGSSYTIRPVRSRVRRFWDRLQ